MFRHGIVHVAVSQLNLRPSCVLMRHMSYRDMMGSDSTAVCVRGLPMQEATWEPPTSFALRKQLH